MSKLSYPACPFRDRNPILIPSIIVWYKVLLTKEPCKFKLHCRNLISLVWQVQRFGSYSSYFCKSP